MHDAELVERFGFLAFVTALPCDGNFDEDCTPDVIGRTGGCNCASSGPGMGWLGLAMLAGLRRRR